MSQRRRLGQTLLIAAVVSVATSLLIVFNVLPDSTSDEADQVSPTTNVTVPIEVGQLIDQSTSQCTVTSDASIAVPLVTPANTQQAVVSLLPNDLTARSVTTGSWLFEVSNAPQFLVIQPVPMFRDLSIGMNGTDVLNLQSALRESGIMTARASGTVDNSTAAAIDRMYRNAGYAPPRRTTEVASTDDGAAPTTTEEFFLPAQNIISVPFPAEIDYSTTSLGATTGPTLRSISSSFHCPISQPDTVKLSEASQVTLNQPVELSGTRLENVTVVPVAGATDVNQQKFEIVAPNISGSSINGSSVGVDIIFSSSVPNSFIAPVTAIGTSADGGSFVRVAKANDATTRVPVQVTFEVDGRVAFSDPSGELEAADELVIGQR